ncbi:MAG: tetratricopeptide repeat protein, partial [Actinomycetota bacterium]|nr:tetratricopeptide repeat protein [Actinomycetota bacterium]
GRLHRRIGEALESLAEQDDGSRLPALAHHFAEAASAGAAHKAADYALAAARQAVAQAAWEDAAAMLDRGLEALEASDPSDAERRCDLLLLLAETWTRFYDPPRAAACALPAAELARALGSPDRLGWAAYWYLRSTGGASTEPTGASSTLAEEALVAIGDDAPPGLRARLLAMTAQIQWITEKTSNTNAGAALALARRSGDPGALGVALSVSCSQLRGSPYPEEHLALAEELVTAAPPDGWDGWRQGYEQRAMARLALGDRVGFEADVAACQRLGAQRRYWYYRWVGGFLQATLALLDGRFAEVEALAAQARDVNPQWDFCRQLFARQMFRLHLERGNASEAKATASRLVSAWPDNSMHRGMLALARVELGELDEVRQELEGLATLADGAVVGLLAPDDRGEIPNERWPVTLAYWAEVTAHLSDSVWAETLYRALRPYEAQVVIGGRADGCMGAVDRYLGVLATTMGRWQEAQTHYEAALVIETKLASPPLLARTRALFGQMLLERGGQGDATQAKDLLFNALAAAERLGMAGLVAQVGGLIGRS